ncbi:RlmE family RNA methyltransferase [Deefgea tanakiae]|uniref:Ribosomal RNA large subunit methyltransferase E n=1 Tax=Deefgea tanakiae TaxID=2865840 RepID=A0ABX8ZEY9_9NEIS|nr:RlmE family RNA methyltransferase [Deefgea tanakiae]QZA79429.1 RlmE family RNA methyltransferase [Deefgea tanakiae]
MMARSNSSNVWLQEHVNDHYVQMAKKDGYRARAAYKLIEIDDKDKLLKQGMWVADLGAAPGSWCQVAAQKVGPSGRVFALDILEMDPIRGVEFVQGDFREDEVLAEFNSLLNGRQIDLVICDIAPNITGNADTDQARSMYLCELGLEFAREQLKPGGNFLVKVFQGYGFTEYMTAMRETFASVVTRKPKASRDRSPEVYLLGKQKKS